MDMAVIDYWGRVNSGDISMPVTGNKEAVKKMVSPSRETMLRAPTTTAIDLPAWAGGGQINAHTLMEDALNVALPGYSTMKTTAEPMLNDAVSTIGLYASTGNTMAGKLYTSTNAAISDEWKAVVSGTRAIGETITDLGEGGKGALNAITRAPDTADKLGEDLKGASQNVLYLGLGLAVVAAVVYVATRRKG